MQLQIAGKNIELGDSLQERIRDGFEGAISKYFDRATNGAVTFEKQDHEISVSCEVHLSSGIDLQASGSADDPYAALEVALEKLEKRVRRYKRRLKDHHRADQQRLPAEMASSFVLRPAEDEPEADEPDTSGDAPAVVAELKADIKTMTVSMAVLQLELVDSPALLFRNAAHGDLNMVYRRDDGHIGWVDPARNTPS